MATQIRVISDDDWNVLKRLVEANRNVLQNPPNRPSTNNQYQDGDDSMSPEVYIALPPLGGISAMLGTTPGVAVCEIYRISRGQLIAVSGVSRQVYNFSETDIAQDYITIKRDKFGSWIPAIGGGTSIRRGKLATQLSSGSRISPVSATLDLWEFDGTDWAETDPLQQVSLYDDGMVGDTNSPLTVGTWVQAVKINGHWFYDGHNCDPSTGTGS